MLPYLRFQLRINAVRGEDGSENRPLTSALLRRVFGKALVDAFCVFGRPFCQPSPGSAQPAPLDLCALAHSCPYGVLFAGSRTGRPPFALHFWPPSDGPWKLEITLFSDACRLYPWALSALQRACGRGLGRSRRRFRLEEVSRLLPDRRPQPLCGADLGRLDPALPPDSIGPFACPVRSAQPVQVDLLSPTRLIREGKLMKGSNPVPFSTLIARILDRLEGLYGEDSTEILQPQVRRTLEN